MKLGYSIEFSDKLFYVYRAHVYLGSFVNLEEAFEVIKKDYYE